MRGLDGKVALVTGGTGIVGSAVSRRLAEEGARVVVTSRDEEKARDWIDEHGESGMVPLELDLGDPESIEDAVATLEATVGIPTVLVANASSRDAIGPEFDDLGQDSFRRLFEVDVAGHVLLARRVVEALDGDRASVVFLSSIYALAGVDYEMYPDDLSPSPVHYAGVKAAALGTTRHLAARWGRQGVRVNALVSGGVRSGQSEAFVENYDERTLLGRMADADEVAAGVAFLASSDASYVTGETLVVDGGFLAW